MGWKLREKEAWLACVGDLLADPAVQSMRTLPQHRRGFSCYHHCLLVSYVSFALCHRLGWRSREAARGGLLHDFYLYDWTDRRCHSWWDHAQHHARRALEEAEARFPLTARERDIIATHMFPLTPTLYHFRESFLVSTVDKLCAVAEVLGFVPKRLDTPALGAGEDGGLPQVP